MKLNEMRLQEAAGRAALDFADFLADMDAHYDPGVAQKIRTCAAHFIKAGFSFGKVRGIIFDTMGFSKGGMTIALPNKASARKHHTGVSIRYDGAAWEVSFAKAAKLDFPKLFDTLDSYSKAKAELKSLLGQK